MMWPTSGFMASPANHRVRFERDEAHTLRGYVVPADHPDGHAVVTRQADRTGLISWKGNRYSVPMNWQRQTVWVRETDSHIVVLDVSRQEIARYDIQTGKGAIVANRDHYRDKETTIRQLEAQISEMVQPLDASDLFAVIKHTSPTIYKDQLTGIRQILRKRQTSIQQDELDWICSRPELTATRFRELLAVAPEMVLRREQQGVSVHTGGLDRYAGIAGGHHAHI